MRRYKAVQATRPTHPLSQTTAATTTTMSSASSDSDGSSILTDATSEPGDSVAEDAAEGKTTTESSVREVYLICDEDAREHEDAVELVNWSTFEEWKQPWHVVPLWEGSVYDEMTLWGSIPLQNDKLRKVPKQAGGRMLTVGYFRAYLQVSGTISPISFSGY